MTIFGFSTSKSKTSDQQASEIPVATPTNPDTKELQLSSETQYNIISSADKEIKINAKVIAPLELAEEKREALDLVCVLDVSSSMNGQSKLKLCQNTLDFMVSQLGPSDRLSLVTFSSNVQTVQTLKKMDEDGKAAFRNSVKKVRASGMTNLSGGLLKGVSEVLSQREDGGDANPIQSILLLTDGQANVGIKDKDELVEFLYSSQEDKTKTSDGDKSKSLPYSIYTFGFGTDHNVELLKGLSDAANGVYYFIDDLDKVGNAFGDCLGGLLSIVSQNTTLEIIGTGCTVVDQLYTDYPSKKKDNSIIVELGDLYAEEQRNILSSFKCNFSSTAFADTKSDTQIEICRLKLSSMNLLLKKMEKKELSVFICVRDDSKQIQQNEKGENLSIAIHYNRWETSKTLKEADKISDDHTRRDHAIKILNDQSLQLKNLQAQSSSCAVNQRDLDLLTEMQNDIDECVYTVKSAPSRNCMQKKGFMLNKMNKLGRERGNSFTNYLDGDPSCNLKCDLDNSSLASSGVQPRKVKSVFETRHKQMSKMRASKW